MQNTFMSLSQLERSMHRNLAALSTLYYMTVALMMTIQQSLQVSNVRCSLSLHLDFELNASKFIV